ncbi:MAG: class I SAM-dependent methyltransferase [Polyangiaceae bacterium]
MATPWDRAAEGYLEEWVPRFVPYHVDLLQEAALCPGDRVLVTSAGPGAEVLAVARSVGAAGFVRATDRSAEMVRICRERIAKARLATPVDCAQADAAEAGGGPWDAVLCAFGLWQLSRRVEVLRSWRESLAPDGKVALVTWGPSEAAEPFQILSACLRELEPALAAPDPHVHAERGAMAGMFGEAGLAMVRHTIVRHTLTFRSAEEFVSAMRESCTWRRLWEEMGDARMQRVAALFYERIGGPGRALSFDPPATIAIGVPPGAEVALRNRPSVRAPG